MTGGPYLGSPPEFCGKIKDDSEDLDRPEICGKVYYKCQSRSQDRSEIYGVV